MWVIKSALRIGIDIMKKWGFAYKDMITWEKIDADGEPEELIGKFFQHQSEILIMGIKGNPEDFKSKINLHKI